jgi:hypothetical protein
MGSVRWAVINLASVLFLKPAAQMIGHPERSLTGSRAYESKDLYFGTLTYAMNSQDTVLVHRRITPVALPHKENKLARLG